MTFFEAAEAPLCLAGSNLRALPSCITHTGSALRRSATPCSGTRPNFAQRRREDKAADTLEADQQRSNL